MDAKTLAAKIAEARRLKKEIDGATFTLQIPSDHLMRVILEEHRDQGGNTLVALSSRSILDKALVDWEGVTSKHFLLEGEDSVPFSKEAKELLLDLDPELADGLQVAIFERVGELRKSRESARKN